MKCLMLVDLQIDFLPGGALAIKDADQVIPIANQLMPKFDLVVATQDWHPANHGSFAANHLWRKPYDQIELNGLDQTLWPMHCVQNSFGAEFAPQLASSQIHQIIQKGTDPQIDSYSGFFDNGKRKATAMHAFLQSKGVKLLYIMGLATDYCVKFTVLDALALNYKTKLIVDGCKAVNLKPEDEALAISAMEAAGVELVYSKQILA